MIRILIVDDQKNIRENIKVLLGQVKNFQVVGTAADGYEAIALVKDIRPDVILMDIEMPGLDGLEATKIISQQYKELKILIFTSHDNDDLIAKSLKVGAQGYLLKNMPDPEIIRAIHFVCQGYTSIKPTVAITANKIGETDNISANSSLALNAAQLATVKDERKFNSLRQATSNEFLPPVQKWLVISGFACLGVFLAAIVISSKLEYKVTVKAPAKIRPIGELRIVQAASEGKIADILVAENQFVRSGELIAQIDDARLQNQKQQLLANVRQTKQQLAQLSDQIISIQVQTKAEQNLQQRNLASARVELKHQQRLYQERRITTQAKVEEAVAAVELAQDELNRYQELAQTGVISQLQLKEKQAALRSSLAKLQQVQAGSNPSAGEVAVAREQVAQTQAQGKTVLAGLKREQQQLQERKTEIQDRLNNYQQELKQVTTELAKTAIRAPVSGTVQVFNLRNEGQVVGKGDEVATIAPLNSTLEIKAFVPAREIDKVEVGQTTQMRVSACPYSDFGTLMGEVIAISADTKNSSPSEPTASANSNYELSVEPKSEKLDSNNRNCIIRSGMEGSIDIISRKETVLQFLFRKAKITVDI